MIKIGKTLAIVGAFISIGAIYTPSFNQSNTISSTTNKFVNYVNNVNNDLNIMESNIQNNIESITSNQNSISNNKNTIEELTSSINSYNNSITTLENKLNNLENNTSTALTPEQIESSTPYANSLTTQAVQTQGATFIQAQYNLEQALESYYLNKTPGALQSIITQKSTLLNMESNN